MSRFEQAKLETESQIDEAVAEVYDRYTAYTTEYNDREKQAREFKAAGYVGNVPPQVAAYQIPAGLTAQKATDDIIASADRLHGLIETMGALRMQKIAVRKTTIEAQLLEVAQPVFQQIDYVNGLLD